MKMKNNIDIIDNRRNKPENKKSIILIICGIGLILIATVIFLIVFLKKKESSETITKITTEEVVKSSGYTEFLNQTESKDEARLFSEIEKKITEDNECRYGCLTDSESESKNRVSIFYQDSFFQDDDYGISSLTNEILATFFSSVYPEYKSIAYVGSGLKEDEFFALSNNGDVYRININSSKKGISVKNQNNIEILHYSGRLVASNPDDIVIDETDYIDENSLDKELEEELEKPENE